MKGFPYVTFSVALNGFVAGAAIGGSLHVGLLGLVSLALFFAFLGGCMAEVLGTALMVRHLLTASLVAVIKAANKLPRE